MKLSSDELVLVRNQIRQLANRTEYDSARALCLKVLKKFPNNVEFLYLEALYEAEDEVGYTAKQIDKRHARAAAKIRALLPRARSLDPQNRSKMRNEYYWFSHQPKKQYALGIELVAKGDRGAYYSQGVGGAEVARIYALRGKQALAVRWAQLSERAWKQFFKDSPDWFNAYFFFAAALGYQGRFNEMEAALQRGARCAGKSKNWKAIKESRAQIMNAVHAMNSTSNNRKSRRRSTTN